MRVHKLPSSECAYALFDAPSGTGKEAQLELLYQFEAMLPQSIEDVQAVFSKPINDKIIACACDKETVQSFRSNIEVLVPDSFPEWIDIELYKAHGQQLNLLTGSMKPFSSLNRDRATAKFVCFTAILTMLVVFVGVHRRIDQIKSQHAEVAGLIASQFDTVLPKITGPNTQPDAIRFATLLNQARATRTGAVELVQHDLVKDLANVFVQWPTSLDIQVRSFTMGSESIRVDLFVHDNESAAEVIKQLSDLDGWSMKSRDMRPSSGKIDLSMSFIQKEIGAESS